MKGESMDVHPYASIFPEMMAKDFEELCEDIEARGLREPIWTYQGKVLDGRHRYRACEARSVPARYQAFNGNDVEAVEFVVSLNQHRRHLDAGQKATAAVLADSFCQKARDEALKRQEEGRKKGGETAGRSRPSNSIPEKIPGSNQRDSRDTIATTFGTNGKYVDAATKLHKAAPDLFSQVHAGKLNIPQAKREVARREKRMFLDAKAKEAESSVFGAGRERNLGWEVIQGDCLEVMDSVEIAKPRLIFADPPYNIGINYGNHYDDSLDDDDYIQWATQWVKKCASVLADDGSLWVLVSDEYAAEYGCLIKDAGLTIRSWIIWYETFGVNCTNKFNRTHRHLFYAVKNAKSFVFNAEAVSRESDRQNKYNDKRAEPGGKVWDDVWGVNPLIPRVVDNHAERIPDFPTQLPLALLRPIVACASNKEDLVVDLFSGSGTCGAACIELGRRFVGIELSEDFAAISRKRLLALSGDRKRETA